MLDVPVGSLLYKQEILLKMTEKNDVNLSLAVWNIPLELDLLRNRLAEVEAKAEWLALRLDEEKKRADQLRQERDRAMLKAYAQELENVRDEYETLRSECDESAKVLDTQRRTFRKLMLSGVMSRQEFDELYIPLANQLREKRMRIEQFVNHWVVLLMDKTNLPMSVIKDAITR